MKANVDRNRELVQKRVSDPLRWSYRKLGEFYNISKITAEEYFKRDLEKYATPHEVGEYFEKISKSAYYNNRKELSTV